MKTSFNNRELCHIWANQTQDKDKGSSMFFEKEKIYSYGYHFEIARIVKKNIGYGGIIFYNSASYSNTTAKHQSFVRRAIDYDNNKVFTVPFFEVSEYGKNIAFYKSNINELTRKAAKARKPEWDLQQIDKTIREMLDFIKYFNLEKDGEVEQMEVQLLTGSILTPEAIAKIKHEEKDKRAKATAKKKEDIEAWIAGEEKYLNSLEETYLRRKDKEVETSHGATVPALEARLLFRAIKTGKPPVHGFKIGYYTVNSFTNGILKVGCHKITEKEINRFALSQGWTKAKETA